MEQIILDKYKIFRNRLLEGFILELSIITGNVAGRNLSISGGAFQAKTQNLINNNILNIKNCIISLIKEVQTYKDIITSKENETSQEIQEMLKNELEILCETVKKRTNQIIDKNIFNEQIKKLSDEISAEVNIIIEEEQLKHKIGSTNKNICFVIMPIGKQDSSEYIRFKNIYDNLIKKAVEDSGFSLQCIRADDIKKSGAIMKQVIEYLYSASVVIADLTGRNANVFYELGIRHTFEKRSILIAQNADDSPFDVNQYRLIDYKYPDEEKQKEFNEKIKQYIKDILDNPNESDNPVTDLFNKDRRSLKPYFKDEQETDPDKILFSMYLESSPENHIELSFSQEYENIIRFFGGGILLGKRYSDGKKIKYDIADKSGNLAITEIYPDGKITHIVMLTRIESFHGHSNTIQNITIFQIINSFLWLCNEIYEEHKADAYNVYVKIEVHQELNLENKYNPIKNGYLILSDREGIAIENRFTMHLNDKKKAFFRDIILELRKYYGEYDDSFKGQYEDEDVSPQYPLNL